MRCMLRFRQKYANLKLETLAETTRNATWGTIRITKRHTIRQQPATQNETMNATTSETHHTHRDARVQTITMLHTTTRMTHHIDDTLT